jgi:hypothetical protein
MGAAKKIKESGTGKRTLVIVDDFMVCDYILILILIRDLGRE